MLILIKNADVFAPQPLGIRHVLVAGDRIVYVGKDVPKLDKRLGVGEMDANGAPLLPGFIDPHAHVTGGGGEASVEDILVADCVGYERELGPMGVPRILANELSKRGRNVPMFASELEGVQAALGMIVPGDILMLLVKGERKESLKAIQYAMDQTLK
jgi:N-acetylglucosamine-6-phosphate deacetylase